MTFFNKQLGAPDSNLFINKTNHISKIYFGAKFQKYEEKGKNTKNTTLYLIGEIDVKYAGPRDLLNKKKVPITRYLIHNAHQKRKGSPNFIIFAGKGKFYNKYKDFAYWAPYKRNGKWVECYDVIDEFKNKFGSGKIRTSVHLGKFTDNSVAQFLKRQ